MNRSWFRINGAWVRRTGVVLVLLGLSSLGKATEEEHDFEVKAPDGVKVEAQEVGNPNGKEIVFIHGLNQSHLSWGLQVKSDLAKKFHLLTYDFRGHGLSDKPLNPEYYTEGKRWGDELRAVIKTAGFKKPVVVGWSLAGLVMLNYLKNYGDQEIAGLVFVDAVTRMDPTLIGEGSKKNIPLILSNKLEDRVVGVREFLRACFNKEPSRLDFESMLVYNSMVPREIGIAIGKIQPTDYDDVLRSIRVPTLVIHGDGDRLCLPSMGTRTTSMIPRARLITFHESGHAPFWEEPAKFNRELEDFVNQSE